MKKLLLMFLTLIFIIFFTGCDIEFHYNLNIEQAEPYVCEIGDVLPFSNVKFDESTNVIKETALGIYAFEPGEIYIECTQMGKKRSKHITKNSTKCKRRQ